MADAFNLKQLIDMIARERGVDLRSYKPTTLERRIRRRMSEIGIATSSDYIDRIRADDREVRELLNTILINVTQFFRDPGAWDVLREEVLSKALGKLRPGDTFRAWSAGCASGEEPYSLAILIADILGPRLGTVDIKIYATDVDEDALTIARRGEYPTDKLVRLRPEWRDRYFQDGDRIRVARDLRRMVIFGRNNLLSDAPISHCNLVICRNVLIYFDVQAQRQIFKRLHYALEPNGVLFLGKSESKLSESRFFGPLHPRWRIFQRITEGRDPARTLESAISEPFMIDENKLQQEIRSLKLQQQHLLETLKPGVMVLDATDTITSHNESAVSTWGLPGLRLTGKKLQLTELAIRCPELPGRVDAARSQHREPVNFECRVKVDGDERILSITLRPVLGLNGDRDGTVIYAEDITSHEKLQSTVEQLEATSEELQSANEELETTNEELQSTNEELETTNEELQSTNEELETTNEELQSLNEELETMNEELERRTRELNDLTGRYAETLRLMPWPVLLVDKYEKIQLWNSAAQDLFGIGSTSVVGVGVDQLPMDGEFRKTLVRRCRMVLSKNKAGAMNNERFETANFNGGFDLHFTPINGDGGAPDGVLIMFGPQNSDNDAKKTRKKTSSK
jgi:two-component system, chemotaxis family, CheB/CheR fusion protein